MLVCTIWQGSLHSLQHMTSYQEYNLTVYVCTNVHWHETEIQGSVKVSWPSRRCIHCRMQRCLSKFGNTVASTPASSTLCLIKPPQHQALSHWLGTPSQFLYLLHKRLWIKHQIVFVHQFPFFWTAITFFTRDIEPILPTLAPVCFPWYINSDLLVTALPTFAGAYMCKQVPVGDFIQYIRCGKCVKVIPFKNFCTLRMKLCPKPARVPMVMGRNILCLLRLSTAKKALSCMHTDYSPNISNHSTLKS